MIFPEIFYFLSVFFLMKFQKLSIGKTVLKKTNGDLLLAFLIFKTLFRSVLFCFQFFWFLCNRLFYLSGNCWSFFIDVKIPYLRWCWYCCLDLLECIVNKNLYAEFSGLYNVSGFFDYFFAGLVCFFRDSNLIVQRQHYGNNTMDHRSDYIGSFSYYDLFWSSVC
ncbi:MAG: hypothetical protein LBC20_02625 [Planctomycetaceae bacterium]|nr:hypothetical protein [Planctomycetaceae bacterium]